jgi:hypothetical protein
MRKKIENTSDEWQHSTNKHTQSTRQTYVNLLVLATLLMQAWQLLYLKYKNYLPLCKKYRQQNRVHSIQICMMREKIN